MEKLKKEYTVRSDDMAEFTASMPPPSEKAFSYHKSKIILWIISHIWGAGVTALFLFSGISWSISRWADNVSSSVFVSAGLYYGAYSVINYLIDLPLSFYAGYVRKHSYGLSNQSLGKWVGDSAKALLLSLIIGCVLIWIPYTLIRISPNYWWLYVGLLLIPFMVFMSYISPVYIDPIFNKYVPMENNGLENKIHEMLSRTVTGDCKVFQVNKSVDTKEMNAYMTGVFNTKRMVLWDTTINNLTESETLSIVAHEMGHYIMGHVWKMVAIGGAASIFVLYLVDRGAVWVLQKSGGVFGQGKGQGKGQFITTCSFLTSIQQAQHFL